MKKYEKVNGFPNEKKQMDRYGQLKISRTGQTPDLVVYHHTPYKETIDCPVKYRKILYRTDVTGRMTGHRQSRW